jgi:hypothetical protein
MCFSRGREVTITEKEVTFTLHGGRVNESAKELLLADMNTVRVSGMCM